MIMSLILEVVSEELFQPSKGISLEALGCLKWYYNIEIPCAQ